MKKICIPGVDKVALRTTKARTGKPGGLSAYQAPAIPADAPYRSIGGSERRIRLGLF